MDMAASAPSPAPPVPPATPATPAKPAPSVAGSGVPARGRAAAARRRERQREIVASTRQLFDERGMRSANIDDIARAVGINRAIIYRHFASKEELFALALADYLTELDERLSRIDDPQAPPRDRFATLARAFAAYCLEYPAFVDCALALLGRPGPALLEEISDSALLRLGGLMGTQLHRIAGILRLDRGVPSVAATDGASDPADPGNPGDPGDAGDSGNPGDADVLANALYLQVLGVMHLARSGVVLRPAVGGEVSWMMVGQDRIVELVTRMAVAVAFPSPEH